MDEFDHALMEALNEAVPPADFATDLAGRLVARTRRRTRFWKLLFALGLFSAATAAVVTVTTLSGDETEETAAETAAPHMESRHLGGDETNWENRLPGGGSTDPFSTIHYSLFTLNSPQGAPQVQNTILKKAAALMGATALAAATPASADGYQFIVSGYPAANPSHSDVSSGTSLAVGVLASTSASAALEARAFTYDDSLGIALRSDEYRAMMIIFR